MWLNLAVFRKRILLVIGDLAKVHNLGPIYLATGFEPKGPDIFLKLAFTIVEMTFMMFGTIKTNKKILHNLLKDISIKL